MRGAQTPLVVLKGKIEMKYFMSFVLVLVVAVSAFGQSQPQVRDFSYIPVTDFAGVSMSGRTAAVGLLDTTQAVGVFGWSKINFVVTSAGNDSLNILIQYFGSYDGASWNPVATTIDSLVNTTSGRLKNMKSVLLPQAAMGYRYVKFIVSGQAWGAYSATPVTTVTSYVVKKHY